jgi:hypothetical protein
MLCIFYSFIYKSRNVLKHFYVEMIAYILTNIEYQITYAMFFWVMHCIIYLIRITT